MSLLQDLVARLRLDDSDFKRGVSGAKGQAAGLGTALKGALLPVAGALAAAFSARALFRGIVQGGAEIDAVAKSARALDSSIGGFRAIELAAGEAGVRIETLREQSINLARQMASGRADASLRALGLEAQTLLDMDVDQRFASIADRVKELGLNGGEAAALMQGLGVESREMGLAMMQGGDAFRTARQDVEDYGLALSSVDAAKIEAANDSIGRLSLVGQYLRQTLATALLPALGDMSRAFTESLREGGLLRHVIDTLGAGLRVVSGVFGDVGTIVASLARWLGELFTSTENTNWLMGSLRLTLSELAAPFIFILDSAASLVSWFADLIRGAGGFGEALSALGTLASAVWEGMKTSASALGPALSAVWADVEATFYRMLSGVSEEWSRFLAKLGAGLSSVPGMGNIADGLLGRAMDAMGASAGFDAASAGASQRGNAARAAAAGQTAAGGEKVLAALRNLQSIVAKGREENDKAAESAQRFKTSLDELAGGGKGGKGAGGAKGAAEAIKDVSKAAKDAAAASEKWADQMAGHFDGLITSGKGLQGVLQGMARQLESEGWKMLFRSFSGGGGGGGGGLGGIFSFIGNLFGKNANGTENWRGGLSWVGERGPELVNMPRGAKVYDAQTSARMARGGGGAMAVTIGFDGSAGGFTAFVRDQAGRVVAQARPAIVSDAVRTTYSAAREQRMP